MTAAIDIAIKSATMVVSVGDGRLDQRRIIMFRTITARFAGSKCKRCGGDIAVGSRIRYGGRGRTYHMAADCSTSKLFAAASSLESSVDAAASSLESSVDAAAEWSIDARMSEDRGHYHGGYRTYRDGAVREDFHSDGF